MKISEVLWNAANEYLWAGSADTYDIGRRHEVFSCDAVVRSARGVFGKYGRFLDELGCGTSSIGEFDEFAAGEERQGARYLWLMFAYLVAKDEGL